MDNFDVDAYAKSTLNGLAMYSDNDTWSDLSSRLDDIQGRKRRRLKHIKMALIMVLMMSLPSSTNKNDEMHEPLEYTAGKIQTAVVEQDLQMINGVEKAMKPILRKPTANIIVEKTEKGSSTIQLGEKGEDGVGQNRKKEKKAIIQVHEEKKKDLVGLAINRPYEVTDAEVDSLIDIARQNIQRERALQKARAAFTYEMLADVEKEIETEDNGFYEVVKRNFAKFQTVISN